MFLNSSSLDEEAEEEDDVASEGVLIFAGIIITVMILQAVVGNALTILSFLRDKALRTTYNIYLVNLAIADLMIAVISMSIYMTYTLLGNTWIYGYSFCKVYLVSDFLACSVTVILMNVISFDRLMLLKQGTAYDASQTVKTACVKSFISWILAFLLYGPAIIGWNHWTGYSTVEDEDCDVEFANDQVFTTTTAVLEFLLPLICLGTLNTMVFLEIQKLKRNKVHTVQVSVVGDPGTENGSKKPPDNRTKAARKAARSLLMLVVMFVITWAPYTILTVVISFCGDCVNIPVYEATTWILWFKAAFNPFLYAFNSGKFRENFIFFLSCGRKKIRRTK